MDIPRDRKGLVKSTTSDLLKFTVRGATAISASSSTIFGSLKSDSKVIVMFRHFAQIMSMTCKAERSLWNKELY